MNDTTENIYKRRLLRVKEVAVLLAVSISTVYAYVTRNILVPVYLPHTKDSSAKMKNRNFMRFTIEELEKFITNLERANIGGSK